MVELIVVTAILGVLVLMAIPAYSTFKDRAREARAMEEIRGIEKSISAYAIDNGGTLPPALDAAILKDLSPAILIDPWGHPYVYLPGPTDATGRLDNLDLPLNEDYDLYSKGANGATGPDRRITHADSQDDVVRSGNGGFVGLGKNINLSAAP